MYICAGFVVINVELYILSYYAALGYIENAVNRTGTEVILIQRYEYCF